MIIQENESLLSGEKLPIMEHFYTVQGEGAHTGKAAYFIRLGGCDVGCHWCDVKESWDPQLHPLISVKEVAQKAASYCKTVVLTGGEPLMWNLDLLTKTLKELGCTIHIETSGAYPISGMLDWVTLSPKKNALPLEAIFNIANELKVIVFNQNDFLFAEENAAKVNAECKLYLQSEWSKKDKISEDIVQYILKNPKWFISIQTHKYLNIP